MKRLMNWIRANIIADDPTPAYSRLDGMDGLEPFIQAAEQQTARNAA